MNRTLLTRRTFIQRTAAAGATGALATGAPSILHAQNSGEKLRVAFVGVGGIGGSHTSMAEKAGDICPCYTDVDLDRTGNAAKRWPKARAYTDYREMFDYEYKNFDAVMVGTPDHHHHPATKIAMLLGKHVYTQKPLTHTVWEARDLLNAHHNFPKVVTQMGNQGHANEGNRITYEWINSGAIGEVTEVHAWTNRPVWPQGQPTPKGEDPVPGTLNWDAWLGAAPWRPYKGPRVYNPFVWRGWWDFGAGALGDMACHTLDNVFWSLEPGHPSTVEVLERSPMTEDNFPQRSIVKWEFPAKGQRRAFDMLWYDGGGDNKPPRPKDLEEGRNMPNTGVLIYGTKGTILSQGDYGESPRIIPEAKMKEIGRPPRLLERSPGHYTEWQMACKGEKPRDFARSNFTYAAPFSEAILLGNVALKANKKLTWDGPNLRVTNAKEANQYINKQYRAGWLF